MKARLGVLGSCTPSKIFLALLSALLPELALASYFCNGPVQSVTVSPSGVVTLDAPEAGVHYGYLCTIGNEENNVTSEACKSIFALLLTAKSTGRLVQFGFDDTSSCAAHPSWAWVTGWYWGPMLFGD